MSGTDREDDSENDRPRAPHRSAAAIRLLPATYLPMTAEQAERAVDALAGVLAERDQRRARRQPRAQKRARPAP